MIHDVVSFLAFKVIKISGLLLVAGALITALGIGQSEVSYKYYWHGVELSLLVLITARIEGHWSSWMAWWKNRNNKEEKVY